MNVMSHADANQADGRHIVTSLAEGRPWWKLTAGDVRPWISSLHHSAVEDQISRTEWIGDPWDGCSDVKFDRATLRGAEVGLLLGRLRQDIRALGAVGIKLPDASSVRSCISSTGGKLCLAVDVDFGDFVLSVCVDDWLIREPRRAAFSKIVAGMLAIIVHAIEVRQRLADRELRLRRAFEETMASIGDGAAPLWLRMVPFPFDHDPRSLIHTPYLMVMVTLDQCLRWSPTGDERIRTVKNVRDHRGWTASRHRARAAARNTLRATGSEGGIDEIALALIEEQGMNPAQIFRQARDLALADRRAGIEFKRGDRREDIYHRDGRLQAMIEMHAGAYTAGCLSLWGDFPETFASGARRRTLEEFVDHPAFRGGTIRVKDARVRNGALDLIHDLRVISVEEAERRHVG